MITADPHRRAATFDEVCRILERQGPSEDHERLVAFARVAFAEMPDAMALTLEPPALAARLAGYFQFVTSKMPPEHQLYRGLPGIHVVVRNPSNEEEAATGSASGHHHETTIVETHLPDAPFIFESLKNFFQNEGLRVFSAMHPIFTVRRQWERVVGRRAAPRTAHASCTTQFRIERVESRERCGGSSTRCTPCSRACSSPSRTSSPR
jgi:NAD-specific glutamate dehydrogenase